MSDLHNTLLQATAGHDDFKGIWDTVVLAVPGNAVPHS